MTDVLNSRNAGVLLHPTSLPGRGYCGTFGEEARHFVDFVAAAGLRIWQVLPIGPTHDDGCPYQSFSVHAGNPDLIDLQWLVHQGWMQQAEADRCQISPVLKRQALDAAARTFSADRRRGDTSPMAQRYTLFMHQSAYWLEDYVRFQAFRYDCARAPWVEWPDGLRECEAGACDAQAHRLADSIDCLRFRQFVFHCQWHELRQYAHQKSVMLFGDMPIYVHMESADVWAHQGLFDLNADGLPITVSGVPPDYFCAEGQLWGNPQYNWEKMRETGFEWWLQRFESASRQFDIARIDHFRALEAFWEISATATSAREGHWVQAPGEELLRAVRQQNPGLALVAENLGIISPEVEDLRRQFSLPGMRILQFAFDGNPGNPYLPAMHDALDIVYTGTHDNDTTLGWYQSLDESLQRSVYQTFGNPDSEMPWMLIEQAMTSVANTVIVPWQDFLGLDGQHRMNTPGTIDEGNWVWRYRPQQVPEGLADRIAAVLRENRRL